MEDRKQYLDYEGFKHYLATLSNKLRDLEFDPKRDFADKEDLLTLSNWQHDIYGRLTECGYKKGLIVTVNGQFWQLEDPELFRRIMTMFGVDLSEKAAKTPTELGWKVIGSYIDVNGENHTLEIIK